MPAARKPRKRARNTTRSSANSTGPAKRPQRILAIDIGGTKIKFLLKGEHEPRKIASGRNFTAVDLVEAMNEAAADWKFDAVSIGYPGLVGDQGPVSEPGNLGPGWLGFDFAGAFGVPVKIMNDAAMQALGSYEGGRMLFLSLGTGLGSTLIADNVIVPLELGQLPYADGQRLGVLVGRRGLKALGKAKWREVVVDMIGSLQGAFNANYLVLGGGNAKLIKDLPPGARCGNNLAAFRGGFRMWSLDDVETINAVEEHGAAAPRRAPQEWRVI